MTDPIQRHRVSTRDIDLRDYLQIGPDDRGLERVPMFDEWQMATTGISADLEQQRRERSWRERMPTRADWQTAAAGALIMIGIITLVTVLMYATGVLINALAVP